MELYSVVTAAAIFAGFLFLCDLGRKVGRFLYWTSKIPGPSLWQLLTVHAKPMLGEDMVTYLWEMSASYDHKPWGTWMGNLTFVVFLSDRESISAVFKSKSTMDKPETFYKPVTQFLGKGLLTSNGPEYTRHRKIIAIGLRKSLQEFFLRRMPKPMSEFVEALRENAGGRDVDVRRLVERQVMSLMMVLFTSASHDAAFRSLEETSDCMPRRMELIQMQGINPAYYWLFVHFRSSTQQNKARCLAVAADLDDICMAEKCRALNGLQQDVKDAEDIVQALILSYFNAAHGDKVPVTDKELCAQARGLFVASFETTSFVVNALLLVLALHQDVQQRVWDEVESVWEEDRPVLSNDLDRLEYMEMVIKETLRLYPAGPLLARRVRDDINVSGVLVPAGSAIMMNVMALHRNPEYYPDPLKFDPGRFSPEALKKLRPYSFIPFSAGFRSCPGQLNAYAMMKLILCHVVRNFRILPGDKLKSLDDIKVKMCFTLHLRESSLRLVDRCLGTA